MVVAVVVRGEHGRGVITDQRILKKRELNYSGDPHKKECCTQ